MLEKGCGLMEFIPGLELCESFFHGAVWPLLKQQYPSLSFSAGVLGYGSDVLGFDDATSTDHMWGPRLYLFLDKSDLSLAHQLQELFAFKLPFTWQGYPVHFSKPDPLDQGIRQMEASDRYPIAPMIWIHSIEEYFISYLGTYLTQLSAPLDWLCVSEHRLLGATSGRIFHDDLGVSEVRANLSFYPDDVRTYLLASQWSLIAEEQAFVTRTGTRGDEIGTRLITSRIAERLMRLHFLYERKYAPYSKWFGTSYAGLDDSKELHRYLLAALQASTWQDREERLVRALLCVGQIHNDSQLTAPLELYEQDYFSRPIRVVRAERFAQALHKQLHGSPLQSFPLIGSLSQIANFTTLYDDPKVGFLRQQRLYQSWIDSSQPEDE